MPKGIWCNGITRHFDCLDPSPTLGIPVAEWRSLVISSGSYPEDRWFKSSLRLSYPVNMYDDCHVQRQASLEIF